MIFLATQLLRESLRILLYLRKDIYMLDYYCEMMFHFLYGITAVNLQAIDKLFCNCRLTVQCNRMLTRY